MKDSFVEYRILGWQFFSFSTLTISSHCFLASFGFWLEINCSSYLGWVNKMRWVILICAKSFLYVRSHLSFALFTTSPCLSIVTIWGLGVDLFKFFKFYLESIEILRYFSSKLKIFWPLFLKIIFMFLSFSPFLGLSLCIWLYAWWWPTGLLGFVHFSCIIFSLCFSDWIFSIVLSSISLYLYFASSNMLLKLLVILKFQILYISTFDFYVVLFSNLHIFVIVTCCAIVFALCLFGHFPEQILYTPFLVMCDHWSICSLILVVS